MAGNASISANLENGKNAVITKGRNIFFVRLYVIPGSRETVFNQLCIKGCDIYAAGSRVDAQGMQLFEPQWSSKHKERIDVRLTVPPAIIRSRPYTMLFFIEPQKNKDSVDIVLKSPFFLCSASSHLDLSATNSLLWKQIGYRD